MIKTLTVSTPYYSPLVIDLKNPEKSGFFINSIDGLGPARSIINTSESLYGAGGFFNSSRIAQRNVVISLGFYNGVEETIEELRIRSYKHFPMGVPITIEIETDTRIGILVGRVETNEPKLFSKDSYTQISLLCSDPFIYSKNPITTVFNGIESLFEFPFQNQSLTEPLIQLGAIMLNTQANVFYEGEVQTGITIIAKFIGSASGIVIHNVSTSESMVISSAKLIALTGYDFKVGDTLIITTVKENKQLVLIRNGITINIKNALAVTSDWFVLQRNDNVFLYTATSGINNIQFSTLHYSVYEGI